MILVFLLRACLHKPTVNDIIEKNGGIGYENIYSDRG